VWDLTIFGVSGHADTPTSRLSARHH